MRISLTIISLFSFLGALAQSVPTTERTNINTQAPRSIITPYATEAGAATGHEQGLRYALPINEWQREERADTIFLTASFTTPFSWLNRQASIRVEGAAMPYTLCIDNHEVGSCVATSLPAEFNITKALKNKQIAITIALSSDSAISELEGWQSRATEELGKVKVISQPSLHLRDINIKSTPSLAGITGEVELISKSAMLNSRTSRLRYSLRDDEGGLTLTGYSDVTIDMRGEDTTRLFFAIPDSLAWSTTSPHLFTLSTRTIYRGRNEEFQSFKLGFRTIEVDNEGEITINGKPTELKVKSIKSDITTEQLAQIKTEGFNTIKIKAGNYNPEIYNYADSAGLYIISTIPINTSASGSTRQKGSNPTNNPARQAEFMERTVGHYLTTRLHPSVIAYSLADESLNGYNLYESYLYLKSQEPSRPIIYGDSEGEWNNDKLKYQE